MLLMFAATVLALGFAVKSPIVVPAGGGELISPPTSETVNEEDIVTFCQHPDYPTGCESVALYILLRSKGVEVAVEEIVEQLPKGPEPYMAAGEFHGANPEREFVGDPREWSSYGIYNEPIAEVANYFLDGAVAQNGLTEEDIEAFLQDGSVLIAWISQYPGNEPKTTVWRDYKTGDTVTWVSGEHAVVVFGVSERGYKISNPSTGEIETISSDDFEIGFARYGGRVVYYPE